MGYHPTLESGNNMEREREREEQGGRRRCWCAFGNTYKFRSTCKYPRVVSSHEHDDDCSRVAIIWHMYGIVYTGVESGVRSCP